MRTQQLQNAEKISSLTQRVQEKSLAQSFRLLM